MDGRGPVLRLQTNEETGDGCRIFYRYEDQGGMNAFLAILLSAKVANRSIFVGHGFVGDGPQPGLNKACPLTMLSPE